MIKLLIMFECLSQCYYIKETKSPSEAEPLKLVRLKSRQSVTSSNKNVNGYRLCIILYIVDRGDLLK